MEKSVHNNLGIMFELLYEGAVAGWITVGWTITFTASLYIAVMTNSMWFIYLFTVVNILSNIGLTSLVNNLCNPYTVKDYIDNRKLNDKDISNTYSHLKRPTWVMVIGVSAYATEVYILMSGGLFYIGLIWLINYTMLENTLYNNTTKMKMYWDEYSADDRTIQK